MNRSFFIPLCFCLVALSLPALAAEPIRINSGVAVPVLQKQGFAGVHIDPIEAAIVAGTWAMPNEGDEVKEGERTAKWEKIEADKDGWLKSPAMQRGGLYVAATVTAERESVYLLDATGHGMVYVNGEPRAGDVYSHGVTLLPVVLKKGENQLLFIATNRTGQMRATLTEPKSRALMSTRDVTAASLLLGQPVDAWASVVVINASAEAMKDVRLIAKVGDETWTDELVESIPPISMRKVAFKMQGKARETAEGVKVTLQLMRAAPKAAVVLLDEGSIDLGVRRESDLHNVTFRSRIDGSVQYYAVRPAKIEVDDKDGKGATGPKRAGMILALHGAAVQADGHAACYGAGLPWAHVVSPTNRRSFGFDWESFGRLDAMEVLELAEKSLEPDPRRIYLSGHSMGGHGTWQIGVTYPSRFAAIGPSAGWIALFSMDEASKQPTFTPMHELLARPLSTSDTRVLSRNYLHQGIYILHGDQDDNVPVKEARDMVQRLATFHKDFAYREQVGAGHWWGNQCVAWPAMLDFMKERTIPMNAEMRHIEFATANPGVSAESHWLRIEQQAKQSRISGAIIDCDPMARSFTGKTENIARLTLDVSHLALGAIDLDLDGQKLADLPRPADARVRLRLLEGKWTVAAARAAAEKGPLRHGPFMHAFNHRFMFVYSTRGTPQENAWSLAKARFDAERFWYQGNGSIDIVPDAQFDAKAEPDRSVVLYGNAATNSAWPALLKESPIQVSKGELNVGERAMKGDDLACIFLRPRPGSDTAFVAAVAGTGLPGLRITDRLIAFHSRAGYPDWMIVDSSMLTAGTPGVRAAGYFGNDWSLTTGEALWQ